MRHIKCNYIRSYHITKMSFKVKCDKANVDRMRMSRIKEQIKGYDDDLVRQIVIGVESGELTDKDKPMIKSKFAETNKEYRGDSPHWKDRTNKSYNKVITNDAKDHEVIKHKDPKDFVIKQKVDNSINKEKYNDRVGERKKSMVMRVKNRARSSYSIIKSKKDRSTNTPIKHKSVVLSGRSRMRIN